MATLSIRLFGGFAARVGSAAPRTVRRRKARALLAYLALRPGLGHSRESLAALLWSGTTDEHARHNLRQTLFALRQDLSIEPDPVVLDGETMRLRPAGVEVDVAAFERGAREGTPAALRRAVALYEGDLLAGFTLDESPFDDWLAGERQRLRELALDALERLLACDRDAGATERAIQTALRLVTLDPLRESAHRALMELYARQGRRTSALRQYQRCVETLQRELGVKPEPATTDCYQRILGPRPGGAPAGPDGPPASTAVVPVTRYVASGGVNLAYQVIGDGPTDLVLVPGWVSNVEVFWEEPGAARFFRRLASFARLILFDKRGTGLSDRVPPAALPTLEQRMADVRAVMDAVGCARATLVGCSEGGPMCALFAATYPQRTAGLVMIGGYARGLWSPDHPWGWTEDSNQKFIDMVRLGWGGPVAIKLFAPTMAQDGAFRDWWARFLRQSASPGAAEAFSRMNAAVDIRHVLSAIRVPTLLLHAVDDRLVDVRASRYMASIIPGARHVELPGSDHIAWLNDGTADAIERFVATTRPIAEPDRLLVTVMVVTATGGEENGGAWSPAYQELARVETVRFRGRLLEAADPAVVVAFDGPARAIRCACAILDAMQRQGLGGRAGLHTGECEVHAEGLGGPAVDIARRIASLAAAGEVVVSETVRDLVAGAGIEFVRRDAAAPEGGSLPRLLLVVAPPGP
jgi:DNA-binding SARP family transcriptional activator/pimeloyl-ACP methyl ester carboxylesterase